MTRKQKGDAGVQPPENRTAELVRFSASGKDLEGARHAGASITFKFTDEDLAVDVVKPGDVCEHVYEVVAAGVTITDPDNGDAALVLRGQLSRSLELKTGRVAVSLKVEQIDANMAGYLTKRLGAPVEIEIIQNPEAKGVFEGGDGEGDPEPDADAEPPKKQRLRKVKD